MKRQHAVGRRGLGLITTVAIALVTAAPVASAGQPQPAERRRLQQESGSPEFTTAGVGTTTDPSDTTGLDMKAGTLVDGSTVKFSVETYAPFADADADFEWLITTTGPDGLYLLFVSTDETGALQGTLFSLTSPSQNDTPPTVTVTRPTTSSIDVSVQRTDLGSPTTIEYLAISNKDTNGDGSQQKSEVDLLPDNPKEFVLRIAGGDRIETAIEVSRQTFPDAAQFPEGAAESVVLARADDYPDALAGTPLAAVRYGPLLLNPSASLDTRVEYELKRVLPDGSKVYLLGGVGALSQAVADRLTQLGYVVRRLGGGDRFETAVTVAQSLGDPDAIFLTTGRSFADALSAGPAAVDKRGVIVLTDGASMPPSVRDYVASHQGIPRWAVGAPAAAADPGAIAIVGSDRYATNRAVADAFFADAPGLVGVASGESFADALSGGASMAGFDSPLLLTRPGALPDATTDFLSAHREDIVTAFVFGGPTAITGTVLQQVQDAIHVA